MTKIKRALISVSNKAGIIEFAQGLADLGIQILSTGGTAKTLSDNQIPVTDVSSITNFPEIMGGRVKTLHPMVHGGILARRDIDADVMHAHGIEGIDLVVVNLYPFEKTVSENKSFDEIIENIDIGGPAMIRAAAKNFKFVSIVVEPVDYSSVITQLKDNHTLSDNTRFELAVKAFAHCASYDSMIANTLSKKLEDKTATLPPFFQMKYEKALELRYGENPHQKASFYKNFSTSKDLKGYQNPIQGKELSFNNIADADTAFKCVMSFKEPSCCIVKHANPCGVAIGNDLLQAYQRAYLCDPTSAFGGIIAFNGEVNDKTAKEILNQQFVEVIIAPSFSEDAKKLCLEKQNLRLVAMDVELYKKELSNSLDCKVVQGGLLVQESDNLSFDASTLKVVTKRVPSAQELKDLGFAWQVCQFVKSNAIVYAKGDLTCGIGAGQMSRVFSAKIAHMKAQDANLSLTGAAMASDAFFPFKDSVEMAASIGITCIIQPGGSIRDQEVIDCANAFDIAMVFTGVRHFRH